MNYFNFSHRSRRMRGIRYWGRNSCNVSYWSQLVPLNNWPLFKALLYVGFPSVFEPQHEKSCHFMTSSRALARRDNPDSGERAYMGDQGVSSYLYTAELFMRSHRQPYQWTEVSATLSNSGLLSACIYTICVKGQMWRLFSTHLLVVLLTR